MEVIHVGTERIHADQFKDLHFQIIPSVLVPASV